VAGRQGAGSGHSRVDVRRLRAAAGLGRILGVEAQALRLVVRRARAPDGEHDALFPQRLEHCAPAGPSARHDASRRGREGLLL